MTRIYVGNLPYSYTNDQLQALFADKGTVTSAMIIMDKFSGRSKGFGFVEMENDEEAQKAISELNGTPLEGRNITVSVARPREERPQNGGGFGGGDRRDFRRGGDDRRGGGGDRRGR